MTKQTVQQFFKQFPDDEACLVHLFNVRFGQDYTCPKCDRPANWYRIKAERAFSCQWCGHHIHPTVGTPFKNTRTSLQLWFYAIFLFTKSRHGVSAAELKRQLGVTYKTAWRIGHEIRKHMAALDGEAPLGGEGKAVEVDETYIGGERPGKRGRGAAGKTIVMGMIERNGQVMTKIVPNVKRVTLHPIIEENVKPKTDLHTDDLVSYRGLHTKGYYHKIVQHGAGEYVGFDGAHVNSIESFWRQLKAGIAGTHIWVSAKHLSKYTKEFEYRFNRRSCPQTMLDEMLYCFPASPSDQERG